MGKAAFRALLSALGLLMARSSRKNPWFRNQVTSDVVMEFKSRDGVAHHYRFTRDSRRMTSQRGPTSEPTVSVCFDRAGHGFRALADPHAVGKIVNGMLDGRISVEGNASLLLWFFGLTRIVIPLGRIGPQKEPFAGALVEPNPTTKVFDQVTREAIATQLDPQWRGAVEARATLINLRSPAGESCPMW